MEYPHEIIMTNEDIPFKMFEFEGGDGNYVRDKHWHRSIEMFAIYEGGLEFDINGRKYPLFPGDFIIVNSNEIHSISSPIKNFTVVVQIPLATFEKYYTDDKFIYFTHVSEVKDEEMMALIRDMYDTYVSHELGYELAVQSRFYQLIYHLVTKYRRTDVDSGLIRHSKGLDKLSRIMSYLQDNYNKDISLETLSKTFGYSPTYLSRMFQKYAGTSYKTCIDGIRLEHAKRDLVYTENTIGEIAMNHGFANSKAFARCFQVRYGVLPSEYRRQIPVRE
jgi:AraC-like DNA-binding protein/mannose-6-phosphate isomerase-like protein (cupin superfamily)